MDTDVTVDSDMQTAGPTICVCVRVCVCVKVS